MKKCFYYMTPFVLVPVVMLLIEYLENIDLIDMSPNAYFITLSLCCVVMGIISPTNKKFDCIIPLIMPLSLFCMMFSVGFLDKGCFEEPAFSLYDAFDTAFQPLALIIYCVMALLTFGASFRGIRITKRLGLQ